MVANRSALTMKKRLLDLLCELRLAVADAARASYLQVVYLYLF